jgi:6-phosphogluconolactonase
VNWSYYLSAMALLGMVAGSIATAPAQDMFVLFGSQQTATGTGFRLARFNSDTGELSTPELWMAANAPSYFVIDSSGRHLYATSFSGDCGVSAYSIDPTTAELQLINHIPGGGVGTSYIGLDHTGKFALAANFATGHIAVFPIRPDGGLGDWTAYEIHAGHGMNPKRQSRTYPHCIVADPTNRFCLVPDLGLDKLFVYRFDQSKGTLAANDPAFVTVKPGAGPRHVRFHPNGKWAYLVCEMGSVIYGFNWDSDKGTLSQFQSISTLPAGFAGENNAAELEILANGKFLYVSNRGEDTIAIFSIDQTSGMLTPVGEVPTKGKTPRNFAIDPSGTWMICTNQEGNSAVVFRINPQTGQLTQTGEPVPIEAPCCERFLPGGHS